MQGVFVTQDASSNIIGDPVGDAGNVIAFNGADLDNVDLAFAVYDENTVLTEASTTVEVKGILQVWDPNAFALAPVAVASVLEIHDSLTLTDATSGNRIGRLVLAGGTLVVDPGDVIVTSDDDQGRAPNGIEIEPQAWNVIEVARDDNNEIVVQMDNPIYGGGVKVPPALVEPLSVLSIEGQGGNWGVLALNGDVTFEGLLDIADQGRVVLMGDYIPEANGLGLVQADLVVGGRGAELMGTGRISMNGVGILNADSRVTI